VGLLPIINCTQPSFTSNYGCPRSQIHTHDNVIKQQPLDKPAIHLFISLALPDDTLKQRYQEVIRSEIPARLVLRGLYQNSFIKTAERLKQLKIQVQIDPEAFERYQISAVPAFIFLKPDTPPARLVGNVTLNFATAQWRQHVK
jgi:type-F conjugative transfer system pilin assembly protein TrbC